MSAIFWKAKWHSTNEISSFDSLRPIKSRKWCLSIRRLNTYVWACVLKYSNANLINYKSLLFALRTAWCTRKEPKHSVYYKKVVTDSQPYRSPLKAACFSLNWCNFRDSPEACILRIIRLWFCWKNNRMAWRGRKFF